MDDNNNSFKKFYDLRNYIYSFQKSRVVLTAFELNIFSEIGDKRVSSKQVAKILNTDPRATDRLMNAIVAIGLIGKENNLFFNTDISLKYLIKGSPEYLGGLMHSVNLWNNWSTLTECVKKGKRVLQKSEFEKDSGSAKAFIAAMHERGCLQAQKVISLFDLENIKTVLDIGGGSGAYSFAFVNAKDNITATVFDLPNITPITKRYIKNEELDDKIKVIDGNYLTDDFGTGYDLAFLSAIIHINSYEQNKTLIKNCYNALNPNGFIAIQDHIMSDERTNAAEGAIFSLNLLVGTECGDTYTEKEITEWLNEAGFINHRVYPTFNNSLLIAEKRQ